MRQLIWLQSQLSVPGNSLAPRNRRVPQRPPSFEILLEMNKQLNQECCQLVFKLIMWKKGKKHWLHMKTFLYGVFFQIVWRLEVPLCMCSQMRVKRGAQGGLWVKKKKDNNSVMCPPMASNIYFTLGTTLILKKNKIIVKTLCGVLYLFWLRFPCPYWHSNKNNLRRGVTQIKQDPVKGAKTLWTCLCNTLVPYQAAYVGKYKTGSGVLYNIANHSSLRYFKYPWMLHSAYCDRWISQSSK